MLRLHTHSHSVYIHTLIFTVTIPEISICSLRCWAGYVVCGLSLECYCGSVCVCFMFACAFLPLVFILTHYHTGIRSDKFPGSGVQDTSAEHAVERTEEKQLSQARHSRIRNPQNSCMWLMHTRTYTSKRTEEKQLSQARHSRIRNPQNSCM